MSVAHVLWNVSMRKMNYCCPIVWKQRRCGLIGERILESVSLCVKLFPKSLTIRLAHTWVEFHISLLTKKSFHNWCFAPCTWKWDWVTFLGVSSRIKWPWLKVGCRVHACSGVLESFSKMPAHEACWTTCTLCTVNYQSSSHVHHTPWTSWRASKSLSFHLLVAMLLGANSVWASRLFLACSIVGVCGFFLTRVSCGTQPHPWVALEVSFANSVTLLAHCCQLLKAYHACWWHAALLWHIWSTPPRTPRGLPCTLGPKMNLLFEQCLSFLITLRMVCGCSTKVERPLPNPALTMISCQQNCIVITRWSMKEKLTGEAG